MVVMRDGKGDLSSMFDWIDISSDMFHADKLDRKKVKDLQGTLFTPINAASKHANMLPETITNLRLQNLESSVGLMTDTAGKREGKLLFTLILQELTCMKWTDQSLVLRSYHLEIPRDVQFLGRLKSFAVGLSGFPGIEEVPTGGLLVFRCSHNTLVDSEGPYLFVRTLLPRHMAVTKAHMDRDACKVLGYILTQIHVQNLKNTVREGRLCNSSIDRMSFSDMDVNKGNKVGHEMIVLCSTCRVPSRNQGTRDISYKLCTYKTSTQQGAGYSRTCSSASCGIRDGVAGGHL
ncbi:hypothetical protein XENOCAPTIV_019798 [Xenoophorus captivus]|uniref:Uncharacterized protein n=1 Tax=Xenoophorus captivus TaxID=1517983 RepID=A0ABV0SAV3_9TELE